ncbi:ABC transporter ATP-binding protein [Haloferax mediterranei ATCC 33500]|uniref:Nickel import system ATP-binding protein NikD n=1 Tax=Haloferax mediterranei (strain ATCC 33500 / DSM 1411 / JCM 8866 / NBRC 14739 / NCIMB 2177 / R-4) TaxID=523841 RepID=I3R5P3_HALMT|nr:ABC transporter ATP-binding protein [Haloferax mediterranei]AFK19553.1 ABC-type dipeptide/oligopeptide/nickel transport systems, ATP-binding protein I & II [Haloferax mediterranei ATCC 33500]AHZ22945.1 peptide ABC transporter ATPase [Haloferax mediterranei ATCC 33500]ELZ99873.1 ABC-type dipeptide/oligopeptide/nickel transport system, ATP-binding protein I & II [Haloferax mediterranei ATCC 33500]MDX5987704.1 ABC transporter ATP-binding protein [Haloferax mediterranei ATCC 33500]QCQ74189.1 AB
MTLLDITDLKVTYSTKNGKVHAVNDVSFSIGEGVNYGLAGESGSGKSTIAEALLGLLPDNGQIESGEVLFKGQDLTTLSPSERRDILWEDIAYIPQSAMDALDPVMSTGAQIRQAIQKHRNVSKAKARERVRELYDIVGLDPNRIDDYPHEFSGGMRQRVTIAMALALEPDLIIADEPTTGLDVIVQDKIVDKILEIQERMDSSLLLITHEIGVIAETCDDLSILYGGKVMEQGSVDNVLINPTNPYTMGLKNSFPEIEDGGDPVSIPGSPPNLSQEPSACVFKDRCPFSTAECEQSHPDLVDLPNRNHQSACHHVKKAAQMRRDAKEPETWGIADEDDGDSGTGEVVLETHDLEKWYEQSQSLVSKFRGENPNYVRAVDGVSLSVRRSEILGVAGESGCGKSTLGETIALLKQPTGGKITFDEKSHEYYQDGNMKEFRRKLQIIFQDPFDSLNPRQTVRQLVGEPLTIHDYRTDEREVAIKETLEKVGLTPATKFLDQYPHELSGGQRQRVAIARALVVDPDFLICDEPASMLDVSLKVNLLNLLRQLADTEDIGIVYISHDLASLVQVSDRLAIMYLGRVVETGDVDRIARQPKHPYTNSLLSAAPEKDPSVGRTRVLLEGEPPDPVNLPSGCTFAPRCPKASDECWRAEPALTEAGDAEHMAACYFPEDEVDQPTVVDEARTPSSESMSD